MDPGEYHPRIHPKRRAQLLGEFERRRGDPMPGGSGRRRGMMTAYRQKAIRIAQYLTENGPTKASVIAHAIEESEVRAILYRNVYGWFDRLGEGVYQISPRGMTDLATWTEDGPVPLAENIKTKGIFKKGKMIMGNEVSRREFLKYPHGSSMQNFLSKKRAGSLKIKKRK